MHTIYKIHRFSGILLLVFIVAHLTNHVYSITGPEKHIAVMQSLRKIYRIPVIEITLVLAAALQVLSGLKLVFNAAAPPMSPWELWQRRSGLYLAFFLLIHLSAVFAGRWVMEADTNFWFGVQGLNSFPLVLFFGPYYSLAILAFFTHLACIHARKMKITVLGLSPATQAKGMLAAGLIVTFLILWGATNGFTGYEIPVPATLPSSF